MHSIIKTSNTNHFETDENVGAVNRTTEQYIVTTLSVTMDGVWIGNLIY
jgi:hypothetical protein